MALLFTVEEVKNYVKDIEMRFRGVLLEVHLVAIGTIKTENFHHFT